MNSKIKIKMCIKPLAFQSEKKKRYKKCNDAINRHAKLLTLGI